MKIEIEIGGKLDPYDLKYRGFYCMVMNDGLWGVYDDSNTPIEWLQSFKDAINFINSKTLQTSI